MTEKRFRHMRNKLGMQFICYDDKEILLGTFADADGVKHIVDKLNEQDKTINRLEKENNQFEHTGEHIRLSINIETGELQRHIYATGQWFGDFDRVLCKNWISGEDYQRFIDRIIEVYNTEFKGDMND